MTGCRDRPGNCMQGGMKELVFVYGTLRPGASNAWRMDGGRYVGTGRVRGKLYHIDWYPGLVLEDGSDEVVGELFEVDGALLRALDVFEGASTEGTEKAEYRRARVQVEMDAETLEAWVWEWLGEKDESRRVVGGDWLMR